MVNVLKALDPNNQGCVDFECAAKGFSSMGVKGTLTPFLSAWTPVLIGLGGGLLLLRQASR